MFVELVLCHHCGSSFSRRSSVHTSVPAFQCTRCGKGCTRSLNLEMHTRTCTGTVVVVGISTPAHRGGAASCSSTPTHRGGAVFTVQRKRITLGGAVEVHSVDMLEDNQLGALAGAVLSLESTMAAYKRRHRAYKIQVTVDVMFHKAVVTQPPVTLRCEMTAIYASGSPQLVETARHLLNLIEVYEHNGSGWVFSNFVSLELTLWHLDTLRAGAFVPLPKWIRDKRAVTNVVGTGEDCFKWAVLAGLHPANENPQRMEIYLPFTEMYGFTNLVFPVSLSSVAPFAANNGLSINVYAVEDGSYFPFTCFR